MQQTRGTAPGWVAWALRVGAVAVLVACAAAWLAVDRAHRAARADVRATAAAVDATADLAGAAAGVAGQLQSSLDALGVSTGSTAEAISHTVAISQNLRALVGVVSAGNISASEAAQLEAVTNSLGDLEASLLETEGGNSETQQALTEAHPLVEAAAATLRALPDDLRANAVRTDAEDGRAWWRLAIVLGGAVLLTMLAALLTLVRRPSQPSSKSQP